MPYKNKEDTNRWERDRRRKFPEQEKAKNARRRGAKQIYYDQNKARVLAANRRWRFLSRYGITPDEYDSIAAAQPNCAICGIPAERNTFGKLYPDHSHATGRIRELLCHQCNIALGVMRDDPALLEKAAAYLRKHEALDRRLSLTGA